MVIEKRDRHGVVKATRHVTERWVNDNADWMKEHGFTVAGVDTGAQEETKEVAAQVTIEVPQTETVTENSSESEDVDAYDNSEQSEDSKEEEQHEESVKRNKRKK